MDQPNQKSNVTICLNMIVKNEAHIIVDTLKNLCSYITFSYWVISDTGSTDNTKDLITAFFKEKDIPGELVEHEWVDFAFNRTKALECAFNKSDYLLVFDADDSIVGDFKLPTVYDCDRYLLRFGTNFSYARPLLFTNRKKWRFKGVLHEFLENIDPASKSGTIEGDYHLISGRSGNRNKNPNKYIDDATILKNAHFQILDTDYSLACRYAFYCAQSYKDAGAKWEKEAIEWYTKCLSLNMWEQEKYHSCLSIGNIYMNQKDFHNALKYWYKTVEYDGDRIEGIVNAQSYLRNDRQHLLVNALYHRFKNYNPHLKNKLFLFQNIYNDQLEYNNMISAYYVNDKKTGYMCLKQIIKNGTLDYTLLKSTIDNFKFYQEHFKADTDDNILELFYAFDNLVTKYNITQTKDNTMISVFNTLFDRVRPLLRADNEIKNKTQLLSLHSC
jgi:tetratricopeptide (TPR) repeat protein